MMLSKKIIHNNWILAGIILILFLCTNRYIYGWDDQALEIPLLKHLIDSDLYPGDYYVESLKENFSSYLYPLLAKIINIEQIPATYLILYLISRYFLFFFSLRLWRHLSGKTWVAIVAVVMSFLIGRTEEFLYRTFSHQEFSLAFIMAALFYFYRERYILSALLLGIAANFNALYALFPMLYICLYLLFSIQIKRLLSSGCTFVIAALPFLIWTIPKRFDAGPTEPGLYDGWMTVFLKSCPQNFPFTDQPLTTVFASFSNALLALGPFLFLIMLYAFNLLFNESFRNDKKTQAICVGAFLLLAACFIFSYLFPNRFLIDLNLIRNAQYLMFMLMGYTTIWICRTINVNNLHHVLWAGIMFTFLGTRDLVGALVILLVTIILYLKGDQQESANDLSFKQRWFELTDLIVIGALYYMLHHYFELKGFKFIFMLVTTCIMAMVYIALIFRKTPQRPHWINSLFVVIPLSAMFAYFCYLHYNYVQVTTRGGGFWQLQRNWEDMQKYVKNNTPKDAYLLVPYNMEMGGFRIGSERSIIASYRDCGIVGFDYPAVKEWQQRIKDIETFKVIPKASYKPALISALAKYQVDYIVFTRFAAPKSGNRTLNKQYENELFVLFEVNRARP